MRRALATLLCLCAACGGSGVFSEADGTGGDDTSTGTGNSNTGSAAGGQGATTNPGTGGGPTGGGGTTSEVSDPNLDGPHTVAELDDQTTVAETGNEVAIHCAYPTDGPSSGPYPVVVFGHGFQLPPTQYYEYLTRLASFGYVALTVDFPAGFIGNKHVDNAADLLGGLDWAESSATVSAIADTSNAGATGHSLGGKASLLAATMDARIKATITLDPVDSAMNCSAQDCPDVSAMMPLQIPTGFVGETIDSTGLFQACAPAEDNFQTFYAGTTAPSLIVDVLGANHMSFLDDPSSCGLQCSFCNDATVPSETVTALSRSFIVAFYERHLKGNTGYDTYLTGAEAQSRYVDTGTATVDHK